jgi:type I restriction enzyme S subunit
MRIRPASELCLSSAAWLGRVPRTWQQKKLKYAAISCDVRVDGDDAPHPYVGLEHIESWTGRLTVPEDSTSTGIVNAYKTGDVLFGKLRPYLAKVHEAQVDGVCTPEVLVLRSIEQVIPKFLFYFLANPPAIDNINSSTYGAKMPRANWEFIGGQLLLIPPREEQAAIVSFLDRETARVDTLVEKKQRLLALLEEKRLATITNAVTKGLNPAAPMKDSGIEWLGRIPSHWEVMSLRRLLASDTRNGLYKSQDQFSVDGVPFLQMGEAFAEPIFIGPASDRVLASQHELDTWGLAQGDLIFARRSLVFEGSGKCSLVGDIGEPHILESSMIRVRLDSSRILPTLAFQFFKSAFSRATVLAQTKQVTISGIDSQQLKSLPVVVPPPNEQAKIIELISATNLQIDTLRAANFATIDRLLEYRSALITNAVTGKIDVRGCVSKEAAA